MVRIFFSPNILSFFSPFLPFTLSPLSLSYVPFAKFFLIVFIEKKTKMAIVAEVFQNFCLKKQQLTQKKRIKVVVVAENLEIQVSISISRTGKNPLSSGPV
jgi:hypothetical protein